MRVRYLGEQDSALRVQQLRALLQRSIALSHGFSFSCFFAQPKPTAHQRRDKIRDTRRREELLAVIEWYSISLAMHCQEYFYLLTVVQS
jgi:hypothetical protein